MISLILYSVFHLMLLTATIEGVHIHTPDALMSLLKPQGVPFLQVKGLLP